MMETSVKTKIKIAELKEKVNSIAVLFLVVECLLVGAFALLTHLQYLTVGEHSLVIINPVKAAEVPKIDTPQVGEESEADKIADIIYRKETSNGAKDDKCERIGKHNGYGFRQGVGKNFCLGSDDEIRKLVIEWVEDKLNQGMTVNQMLCYYNTGDATNDCAYLKI